jgi:UDP-N-acetylmuramoyl-L-alanyl-D-glutamate--2,6-diaminopimelate ligase
MPTLADLLPDGLAVRGDAGVAIRGITCDSRAVAPGDLFACLPGTKVHGHAYIPQALAAGAAALLVEDLSVVPDGVPAVAAPDIRAALAWMAAALHGHPADRLTVIGVTGTNGKTTITTLLQGILLAAGHPTGLIGTMAYRIGDEVIPAPHTTPQAPELQALFARMVAAGLTHVVMEVSSHALCLHRVTGVRFPFTAFTNLTQDHLDFHGTLAAYRDAKAQLFADPRYQPLDRPMVSLLNADDPASAYLAARARGTVRRFGLSAGDYRAVDVRLRADGSTFTLLHPGGATPVALQLVGAFNVSNALAALALALELGVAPATAAATLATMPPVDGRFQRVPSGAGTPTVVVDYAHTPDGLEKVLSTAHEIAPGRVVTVFGCGGDRDPGKRPLMAQAAARWSRDLVVTSDNPRTEDPARIIADILAGLSPADRARTRVEPDRRAAIRAAIQGAAPDDLVVLAGKGHEDYQIIGTEKFPFDDRVEAAGALAAWTEAGHPGDNTT